MAKYSVLLWDIDGTLLDFEAAEAVAIRTCFANHGLGICTDEMLERYKVINRGYWEALERNELSKAEVLVGRFRDFFAEYGLAVEKAEAFNEEYQVRLGDTAVFCKGAEELIRDFRGKVAQYAVTNGTTVAQKRKLKNSGLDQLLDEVFISDEVGFEKPNVEFFNAVWRKIGPVNKEEVLIIGDSLTSDIRGGNNVGIATCWYNPKGLCNDKGVKVDYEIRELSKLYEITKGSDYSA